MSSVLGWVPGGAVVTSAEFQIALETRRKAKLEKLKAVPDRPLTDDGIRTRIAVLTRENALLRERAEQRRNKEAKRMALEFIESCQAQQAPKYRAQSNKNRDKYY